MYWWPTKYYIDNSPTKAARGGNSTMLHRTTRIASAATVAILIVILLNITLLLHNRAVRWAMAKDKLLSQAVDGERTVRTASGLSTSKKSSRVEANAISSRLPMPPVLEKDAETYQYLKDVRDYNYSRFLINPKRFCHKHPDIEIVAPLLSHPSRVLYRNMIRETWGNALVYRYVKMRVLFILGKSEDPEENRMLREEARLFGDIVQVDIKDTYKNLTLKSVSWLVWIHNYCPQVPWVFKTDDDVLINVFKLQSVMQTMNSSIPGVYCHVLYHSGVIRDKKSKFYTPKSEFPNKIYPPYCQGTGYLISRPAIAMLYREVELHGGFFWWEDLFITGFLVKRANIPLFNMVSLYYYFKHTLNKIRANKYIIYLLNDNFRKHFAVVWKEIVKMEYRKRQGLRMLVEQLA